MEKLRGTGKDKSKFGMRDFKQKVGNFTQNDGLPPVFIRVISSIASGNLPSLQVIDWIRCLTNTPPSMSRVKARPFFPRCHRNDSYLVLLLL
jgi:hypothetical protein